MIGNVSIDTSLANVWRSWYRFRRGKRRTPELEHFSYYLEPNLKQLWQELSWNNYRHGPYEKFIHTDTKRREISVASIRDRVVHRLLYDYLYLIYDMTFIYDAWSCRKGKGLLAAIERTEKFLSAYPHSFVWRADVTKFFDSVDRSILKKHLERKIKDSRAQKLLYEIIDSYSGGTLRERERERERVKCRARKVYPSETLRDKFLPIFTSMNLIVL